MTPDSEILHYNHYAERRGLRSLPEGSGEEVLQNPDARYYDTWHNRLVAVKRMYVLGAECGVAVAYEIADNVTWLVTIHPLKEGQQQNRLQTGRWMPYEPESELLPGA